MTALGRSDTLCWSARARRLAWPYGRAGRFRRVEDEPDLEHHVRHVALPGHGRIRELLANVS